MKHAMWGTVLLGTAVWLNGCASKGDAVPINVGIKPPATPVGSVPASGGKVAVTPFQDDRSDRTKLGNRHSFWGTDEPYSVKNGTVGEATAKALAEYLTRKGWRAYYAASPGEVSGADVVISGKIQDLSADAHGALGSTDIAAKNKVTIHAVNQADRSSLTSTTSHTGTYTVFWYGPEDGEEILSEVLERNFEKFVGQTKFDGAGLRFR
ncbi:MAG: hypothetical protein RI101_09005 [Nitrospira sp.]|nr:hypothetical protein [Nitrospira sp.]